MKTSWVLQCQITFRKEQAGRQAVFFEYLQAMSTYVELYRTADANLSCLDWLAEEDVKLYSEVGNYWGQIYSQSI